MTTEIQSPDPEAFFLVHAGGDAYQAEIVPESKLDDAFLLTQWGSLGDLDAEEREDALHHFHDDDAWTHTEVTGKGERLKFSLQLEDGWIEVVRLPSIVHAADVARLESQNRAIAELIIRNDKAGAVKWAQGLVASVEVRAEIQAPEGALRAAAQRVLDDCIRMSNGLAGSERHNGALAALRAALAAPAPQASPLDVERLIRECLPGCHSCDPQAVADAIRQAAELLAAPQTKEQP